MRRVLTLMACATLIAAPAWGDEKEKSGDKPTATGTFTIAHHPFWIGAMCQPTDGAVREQLDLGDAGLTVFQVLPNSPAAKAGLQMHDVITGVGGKPVSTLQQLMEAVAGGKKLELAIIRSGKKENLTVEPQKRPEGDVLFFQGRQLSGEQAEKMRELTEKMRERLPQGEARQMQEWVEKFGKGEQQPLRMHMFGPGVVMHSAAVAAPLPNGVTVTIKKTGSGPTAITVERGDETWTVNDKELHRLPKDLQGPVGAMVGGGAVFGGNVMVGGGAQAGGNPATFNIKTDGAAAGGVAIGDGGGTVQVQIQTQEGNNIRTFTIPAQPGAQLPPKVQQPGAAVRPLITAQVSPSAAELENLKKQVDQLQKRVEELQKQIAAPAESKKRNKSKEE